MTALLWLMWPSTQCTGKDISCRSALSLYSDRTCSFNQWQHVLYPNFIIIVNTMVNQCRTEKRWNVWDVLLPMDQPKRQGFLGQFYFQDDEGFSRWHLDLCYLESWLRNHHKLNNTAEEKSSLKVSCWSVYDPCSCLSQLVPLSSKTN